VKGTRTRTAPVTCECGCQFTGTWVNTRAGELTCPACGRVFEATWPGFDFPVVTV